MAHRKCYGYEVGSNGELAMNPEEAKVVRWIFERYLAGDSLGKIASGLEQRASPPPPADPNGIGKRSTNCSLTKNILGG